MVSVAGERGVFERACYSLLPKLGGFALPVRQWARPRDSRSNVGRHSGMPVTRLVGLRVLGMLCLAPEHKA